jgi:hypothetical protein
MRLADGVRDGLQGWREARVQANSRRCGVSLVNGDHEGDVGRAEADDFRQERRIGKAHILGEESERDPALARTLGRAPWMRQGLGRIRGRCGRFVPRQRQGARTEDGHGHGDKQSNEAEPTHAHEGSRNQKEARSPRSLPVWG